MLNVIFLKGLPGSGKSTWAKHYQGEHPDVVRVNKDDLRAMLHNGKHSKGRERFVLSVRDFIIDQALSSGHDVIVDDTNFHPGHQTHIEEIAARHGAVVEVKDFTDVPLNECIARDLARSHSVGERVIRDMYHRYLEPDRPKIENNPSLEDVIICDIDGTLALFGNANPYDRDFLQDRVNEAVRDLLTRMKGSKIILFTGRQEKSREHTEQWLALHCIPYTSLSMRQTGDPRSDVEIKKELYLQHIEGKYNVRMVIDDRLQVCRLWHQLGLPLFRVGDPDADF